MLRTVDLFTARNPGNFVGWVSPKGVGYPCKVSDHDLTALYIVQELKIQVPYNSRVEACDYLESHLGWVRIEGDGSITYVPPLTGDQIAVLQRVRDNSRPTFGQLIDQALRLDARRKHGITPKVPRQGKKEGD